jgi:hypothetical protein
VRFTTSLPYDQPSFLFKNSQLAQVVHLGMALAIQACVKHPAADVNSFLEEAAWN